MKKATPFEEIRPDETSQDVLTEIARSGARKMLAAALEDEVARYVAEHADERDEQGRRLVVRNGHSPERAVQTGTELPLEAGLALERELQAKLFNSADAREGIAAFVEKRTAKFEGR